MDTVMNVLCRRWTQHFNVQFCICRFASFALYYLIMVFSELSFLQKHHHTNTIGNNSFILLPNDVNMTAMLLFAIIIQDIDLYLEGLNADSHKK